MLRLDRDVSFLHRHSRTVISSAAISLTNDCQGSKHRAAGQHALWLALRFGGTDRKRWHPALQDSRCLVALATTSAPARRVALLSARCYANRCACTACLKEEENGPRQDCSSQAATRTAAGLLAQLSIPAFRDKDICTAHGGCKTLSVDRGSQLGELGRIGRQAGRLILPDKEFS